MNLPSIKTVSLFMLVSITFLPFVAPLMTWDVRLLYNVEIIALIVWYVTSLITPLVIKELSTSLLFWIYHFVLVAIPIGSDLVYRITRITPRVWWREVKNVMPVTWYVQGAPTHSYYSFISTLGFLLIPGCILFVATCWVKKYRPSDEGIEAKAL